jgi:hypothetical protein
VHRCPRSFLCSTFEKHWLQRFIRDTLKQSRLEGAAKAATLEAETGVGRRRVIHRNEASEG